MNLRLSLLLALGGSLTAQSFDLRHAHGVVRDDQHVPWLLGHDYKASFANGALTFVPALGSAAARNRPLTLRLVDVRCGDLPLFAANTRPAEVAVGERRVTITHGDLVERYDARTDGVEQSFVFGSRPPANGDIVVRCAIETALVCREHADGTLFFHDGSVGGVTIGGVTGIDSLGQRVAGSLRIVDSLLELRLPAASVAKAAYPLVLDPLLATGFLIGDPAPDDDLVDAAHGSVDGTTLVVFRRTFSYYDQDIRAQRVTADGSLTGTVLSVTLTPTNETEPAVCYVRNRNRHVVCWNESPAIFGPFTLRARSVAGATLGPAISILGAGSTGGALSMSGDRSFTGTKALVAWNGTAPSTASSPIFTATIDVGSTGTLVPSLPHDLTAATGLHGSALQLARSRVPTGIVVLGATLESLASVHYASPLTYDGTSAGTAAQFFFTVGGPRAFAIDGDGTDHLAVWRTDTGGLDARAIPWDGSALTLGPVSTVSGTTGLGMAVGFLGERFAVVWTEPTANPFDNDLRGIALKPDCAVCSEPFVLAPVARPNALAPVVAPDFAGASSSGAALLAWNETNSTQPFYGSVVGQRYVAMVGAPAVFLSAGCGNGGTASAIGPFAPGNEDFSFSLAGGDPTAPFALISLSLGGPSILCGCELTNPIVLEPTLASNGTARYSFVPWCDPSYLGTPIEFQWLLYGAAASPCPFVPNLAASSRMLLTLQP